MTTTGHQKFSENIENFLSINASNIFLYWKGRVALYACLRALGVGEGDEVIIPGLTCVVVPNAIIYSGAKPIYADVRKDTLTLAVNSVINKISSLTKVIILQNTFGLSADVDILIEIAHKRGIFVIEDCTHGFGGFYQGRENGTFADAAFFSTQWNKPFSTGLGGILLLNTPDITSKVLEVNRELIQPSWRELFSLQLSLFFRANVLTDSNYWRMVKLFRLLSKFGLVTGSSSAGELDSVVKPGGYFKAMSDLQARVGVPGLGLLPAMLELRRNAALAYRAVMEKHNKWHVSGVHDLNNSHLKFPVLVRDRDEFFKRAEIARIRLSDWFISPIHPVEKDFRKWHLDVTQIPVAAEISLNLLTINTEVSEPQKICAFLEENIGLLL